jgi:hypothetical protein
MSDELVSSVGMSVEGTVGEGFGCWVAVASEPGVRFALQAVSIMLRINSKIKYLKFMTNSLEITRINYPFSQ